VTLDGTSREPLTRYWLASCPDPEGGEPATTRLRLREIEPGQFDGKPYEPFEVPCWTGAHEGHTMYPCSREEYEADDA
jgi:hypothetical protein